MFSLLSRASIDQNAISVVVSERPSLAALRRAYLVNARVNELWDAAASTPSTVAAIASRSRPNRSLELTCCITRRNASDDGSPQHRIPHTA